MRRRYQASVRKLRQMMEDERVNMDKILQQHLADLGRWGGEYGRSLDSAVELTLRHAEAISRSRLRTPASRV